jgi:hypothetical protein
MEHLFAVCLGIGLSAAVGFRIFVPPFLVGVAAAAGWLELPASAQWLASPIAIVAFGIAMAVEVLAYMIPWVDQLLDTIATPTAVVAGALLTASLLGDLPPALQWTLAIIAGGGASATTQGLTAMTRATSTVTTAGVGNPLVSATETVASVATTILTAFVPIAVAGLVLLLAGFTVWKVRGSSIRRSIPVSRSEADKP